MKTKHLFLATALVASFASCTNDDIVEVQQGIANAERPTVDNVKLNFVEGGMDSRLIFNGKYAWEATDTIGALLMDQPTDNAGKSNVDWTAQYTLSKWVNTSFPFTYNTADKTWSCAGKMLEGNYFFAFPWSSYDGMRSVKYDFSHQEQNGIAGSVVAENYAKNQLFIGYAQIKGGKAFDVLTDVEMTNVLGAIQLRIKNTGEKDMHINRILLSNSNIVKYVTFDPTKADYIGEGVTSREFNIQVDANDDNVWDANTIFNFANYVGDEDANEYNLTADNVEDYDRMEALRAVVNPSTEGNTGIVQLSIKGEDNVLEAGATAYALIMVNEFSANLTDVTVKVYSDEGMASFALSTTNYKNAEVSKSGVITVAPGISNTIVASVDSDNLVASDESEMDIYSEEDIEQLLAWNAGVTAKETVLTATLKNDVEFTTSMLEALMANKNLILNVVNPTSTEAKATEAYTLTLAEDLPADVLNYEGLDIDVAVAVEGTIDFAKETIDLVSIKALEGATLNINVLNANVPATVTVDEGATLNIGAAAKVSNTVTITNNGKATIAAGALVQGELVNGATLTLNGTANKLTNYAGAVVTMGENATINAGSNAAATAKKDAGIIYTAKGVTIAKGFTNSGDIQYVDGADIKCSGNRFVAIADATLTANTYKDKGVNIFVLTGGTVKVSGTMTLATVKVKEDAVATISVSETKDANGNVPTLTISSLQIKKNAALTTNGNVIIGSASAAGSISIAKDGEWTNNGTVSLYGAFTSEGSTYNNGSVTPMTSTSTKTAPGTWKGNAYGTYNDAADKLQKLYDDAINAGWVSLKTNANTEAILENYYDYNIYNTTMWAENLHSMNKNNATVQALFNGAWYTDATSQAAYTALDEAKQKKDIKAKLDANVTSFKKAIANKVYWTTKAQWGLESSATSTQLTNKQTAFKELFIKDGLFTDAAAAEIKQSAYVYKTEALAYESVLTAFAKPNADIITNFDKYANVWQYFTTENIKSALTATVEDVAVEFSNGAIPAATVPGKYVFVWDECDLDKVVDVMVTLDGQTWETVLGLSAGFTDLNGTYVALANLYTLKGVQAFLKAAYTTNETGAAATAAKNIAATYYLGCKNWEYSDAQVKACQTNETAN